VLLSLWFLVTLETLAAVPLVASVAFGIRRQRRKWRGLKVRRGWRLAAIRLGGNGPHGELLVDLAVDPGESQYARLERLELERRLASALRLLPDRERDILSCYYEGEMTLAEIGTIFGVSESRVSQLRTQAIARLRTLLSASTARKPH